MKYPAKTDIAVLLLFFTRSDTFARVFEAVRQARPSKLFLYQDGPRGERDMAGIMACREIGVPFPPVGIFISRQGDGA